MITIICTNFGNSEKSEIKTGVQKNMATSGQKFQKILFMASSCTYYVPKCGLTRLCDQNCGVQSADRQTDRHTVDGQTKV